MPTYNVSVAIAANQKSVWQVLAAVISWPEWLPTVTSVEPLDGPQLSPGARYKIIQPKLRPATWVVTNVEPPRRFLWESRSPGILAVADHIIEEPRPGSSNVVLRVTFSGFLGAPIGWLLRSITERYLAQEAAALKRKVEGANADNVQLVHRAESRLQATPAKACRSCLTLGKRRSNHFS